MNLIKSDTKILMTFGRFLFIVMLLLTFLLGLVNFLTSTVSAATQCCGSTCIVCPDSLCTRIYSCTPSFAATCLPPIICSDGSTTCGSCPQPPPTPQPTACTPNATRCNGCDRVQCLSDGSGEIIVGPGACCSNPTPPPPPNNPPSVTITYPSNGSLFDPNQAVAITANASDNDGTVTQVDFIVDGVSVGIDTSAPYAVNYTTPLTGGNKTIIARARDDDGAFGNSAPVIITIRPTFSISGTIYEDNERAYEYNPISGRCENISGAVLPSVQPGVGSMVINTEGGSAVISDSGTYSIDAFGRNYPVSTVYPLTLQNFDSSEFKCTCPDGCTLAAAVGPDQTGVNFYVSRRKDPWLQVSGGDVHAQGHSLTEVNHVINNPVPTTCEEESFCTPFSLTASVPTQPFTSGLLSYHNGIIDSWGDAGDQIKNISEGNPDRMAKTNFSQQLSYHYFTRLTEQGLVLSNDFTTPHNAAQPIIDPSKVIYHQKGTLVINSSWDIPANQKLVIFVGEDETGQPGNLIVGPNSKIDVATGGFLAFIVSGNIIVDADLGNEDPFSTSANLTGFFIASNKVIVNGHQNATNKKLVVAGSLIGIDGVEFNRDFNTLQNNHHPVMEITYRPDLILNAPEKLKLSRTTWKALAP